MFQEILSCFRRLFSRRAGAFLVPATNSTPELRWSRKLLIAVSQRTRLAVRAMGKLTQLVIEFEVFRRWRP
jgi:hypothetical protein